MAAKLTILLVLFSSACATQQVTMPDPMSWLTHRFTITPIRIPGFSNGYPFPATFPFPVTYPLPVGFPYTPTTYEHILPQLIAQYNAVLATTANNVAAAAAAAAAVAPAISYTPPEATPTTTQTAPPTVAPAYRYIIA